MSHLGTLSAKIFAIGTASAALAFACGLVSSFAYADPAPLDLALTEGDIALASAPARELVPGNVAVADIEAPLSGPSLGQRILRYLALETSHLALGMTPITAAAIALPPIPGEEIGARAPSVLSGLAILPAGEDWSIYARFGLTTSLADPATLAGQSGFTGIADDTLGEELLWGVGVGYQFSEHWTGRFDFQQVPVLLSPGLGLVPSTTRYDMLSIGLTYDF